MNDQPQAAELDATQADESPAYLGTGSYSPEDNKLRFYAFARLSRPMYERVKAAGFQWAPKQELFVAPSWSPGREDFLIELCGEIDDEDYSPTERAADRAERFENYRDKGADEAGMSADAFADGPQSFGHQSTARAERQAARHDRTRTYAVNQWSKAEYWQQRTQGVISSALYKSSAPVRRSRIKRLEAEQRKHEKSREEYATRFKLWQKVLTLDGLDSPIKSEGGELYATPAGKLAYALANSGHGGFDWVHPRNAERKTSMYSLLTDAADPITPREAADMWLLNRAEPGNPSSNSARWSDHYNNRLTYERAMLASEGGTAADAEMEPGGWINTGNRTGSVFTNVDTGWKQIQSVNKSPATKLVTSVKVWGKSWSRIEANNDKPILVSVNIERLPEGAYRAPTAEERAAFATTKATAKAEAKASKPAAPSLINPTDADAGRLQAAWNEHAAESHKRNKRYGDCPVSQVRRMTQAEYSQRSKGSYGSCESSDVSECLTIREFRSASRVTVFKVRTASAGGSSFSACRCVIVLTDKPQKPLPWDAVDAERAKQPTEESVFHTLGVVRAALGKAWIQDYTDDERKAINDAAYVGWAYESSASQKGFTEAGIVAFKRYEAAQTSPAEVAPTVATLETVSI